MSSSFTRYNLQTIKKAEFLANPWDEIADVNDAHIEDETKAVFMARWLVAATWSGP